jgi:hypothetical protein
MGYNHVIGEVYRQFEKGSVTLKRFPDLPHGLLITDKKGDGVIFYWDDVRQEVKRVFPDEKGKIRKP